MRFLLTFLLTLTVAAGVATAQITECYGWEDGGTTVGSGFNMQWVYLANTDAEAYEGDYSLEIWENGGTTTPQAYVAWITGLQEGDEVTATVMTLDRITGNPSLRIWGHWTPVGGDVDSYSSSAGGNATYSGTSEEWIQLGWTWTVGAAQEGMGLVVEIRPYNGSPFTGANWIDNLCVTAPDHCWIYFPGGVIGAQGTSLSAVKALFR